MKNVLGLDLGTNSIGWALVTEDQNNPENNEIIKLGVRVNPLSVDEKTNFENGRPNSINADRTLKRGARRNLQRYKLRREDLIDILIRNQIIDEKTKLSEKGKNTTHQYLELRAKAATQKIEFEEFARVLLMINKKRGYKSSRKARNEEEGQAIDGMAIAKFLYEENLTPGEYVLSLLKKDKKYIPDFYRSDLQNEFDLIWKEQEQFYPNVLDKELYQNLKGKNKTQTWAIIGKAFSLEGIKRTGNSNEKKLEEYQWRVEGLTNKLEPEYFAIVMQNINNDLNKSSGYLGAISDRSKELYFNKETVGQNLFKRLQKEPHYSLKNKVFYRQDYLDEFEKIWETQSQYYNQLTPELKEEIRDVVIFYQRKLKSQKGMISFCQFESREVEIEDEITGKLKKRTIGRRVVPKSSPVFQEAKIWQNLNNLIFKNIEKSENITIAELDQEIRNELFAELNLRGDLKPNELLGVLEKHIKIGKKSGWECNYDKVEGNRTNAALYNVFQIIAENEGYGHDWSKKRAPEINDELQSIFPIIGIDPEILNFDALHSKFDKQTSYQFWHLLYSAEDDLKKSDEDVLIYGHSDVALKKQLHEKFGFQPQYAQLLTNISFQPDYGNLSAKALRNILPFLIEGDTYDKACAHAGYNHSSSRTREDNETRSLKRHLTILKKNSLRNPVVEKILNQMVNVVNQVIDQYGKPDEVRIELARELKKSAKQRAEMTKGIADATKKNDDIRKLLKKEFGIPNATKNDVTRYKLWVELESRGYKELFQNEYIPKEKLFSKEIDIEHIIPKALLFDDSFSNKTITYRDINLKKGNRTAFDFINSDYHSTIEDYTKHVEGLYKSGAISRAKQNKLLMSQSKLPNDFIERDLRNSQYIAREAYSMLNSVIREVTPTTGSITDKLREDWDLINVMKELNLPKFKQLGLIEYEERLDKSTGKLIKVEKIKDWSKRNDHRHHAMDALTVAFTSRSHIQYLNNLNAISQKDARFNNLKEKITKKYSIGNGKTKRKFIPPMENFRTIAKSHIESILTSIKAKNKVVTKNINKTKIKGKNNFHKKIQLTPRGQLHKETVYGKIKLPKSKPTKINSRFSLEDVKLIKNLEIRKRIISHVLKYDNNPSIAFSTKTLKKDPLLFLGKPLKEVYCYEEIFTIRKDVNPELNVDKVIDDKVRAILFDRLEYFKGNKKEAFSDLDKNPIWLNEIEGISIKRVTIRGVSNAIALHSKKDHFGKFIFDLEGNSKPTDFVSTGNNHHVAIYQDAEGNLQEQIVSLFEAVILANQNLPIIDKEFNSELGWKFCFSMKQNEMFIFPSEDFDPFKIDLMDPKNSTLISPNLFRVQKITSKDYFFRHHLETTVDNENKLKNVTWRREGLNGIRNIQKVRLNHLGQIVQIGEY